INAGDLGNTTTFNSITNGKIGDERNFVGAKLVGSNATVWNADEITVKDGDTIIVRLSVHNNSPLGTSAIAEGVKAYFSLPTTVAKSQNVIGYISASNATPNRYWDEVKLTSDDDFYVEYVEGSAKYTNTQGTFSLMNSIVVNDGAMLGFTSMDGKIPGCYEYDGQVTIELKVHKSVISKLSKTVRKAGTHDEFTESINAKVGDEVEFQIEYKNLTDSQVDNVMIRDILPTNMEYVEGSTVLYNTNHQSGLKLDQNTVATSGINIGSYVAKGNAFVRFTAKVVNKTLACGNNQLVNWANVTVNSNVVKDDASVMVDQTENCKKSNDGGTTVDTIANTGAGEIAGAALGAGSIVTAAGYFIASRKKLM
ncbi:DUF11 domain-containing protein, partial [Candidatus Saccharibacteria bacterium]|nr:DUF11 domain-containing protein [Candidatus Saccharibacteria bacterium]